jgi:hypothetical protein
VRNFPLQDDDDDDYHETAPSTNKCQLTLAKMSIVAVILSNGQAGGGGEKVQNAEELVD